MKDGYGTPKPTPPIKGEWLQTVCWWYRGMPHRTYKGAWKWYREDLKNWEYAQT